jgi:Integrase core domain
VLTIIGQYDRQSPGLERDLSFRGAKSPRPMIGSATEEVTPRPSPVTTDRGFAPGRLTNGAHLHRIRIDARLRDECLKGSLFWSIADTEEKLEAWRLDYNTCRPRPFPGLCRSHRKVNPTQKKTPPNRGALCVRNGQDLNFPRAFAQHGRLAAPAASHRALQALAPIDKLTELARVLLNEAAMRSREWRA